mmetsp:Transcript_7881/g.20608  ORF Transcript_7881/g.20608 Transcript_7881/m.20608 type:complete len:212 (+) Transcript_7881:1001-1636(+)
MPTRYNATTRACMGPGRPDGTGSLMLFCTKSMTSASVQVSKWDTVLVGNTELWGGGRPIATRRKGKGRPRRWISTHTRYMTSAPKEKPSRAYGAALTPAPVCMKGLRSSTSSETIVASIWGRRAAASAAEVDGEAHGGSPCVEVIPADRQPWPGRSITRTSSQSGADAQKAWNLEPISAMPLTQKRRARACGLRVAKCAFIMRSSPGRRRP